MDDYKAKFEHPCMVFPKRIFKIVYKYTSRYVLSTLKLASTVVTIKVKEIGKTALSLRGDLIPFSFES